MNADSSSPGRKRRRGYVPLFRRVAGMNALLLIAAVGVTIVVLAPDRISSFAVNEEIGVLVVALALMAVLNLYVLRWFIRPLQALTALARRVDLANPGERMPDAELTSEAGELALTFNEMLDRLEAERREATGRVLAGQEAERLRIAQELHDQVGQELTAVLLVLSRLQARVRRSRDRMSQTSRTRCAEPGGFRRIATELRPEALDDLGLVRALAVLAQRFAERSALEVVEQFAPDLPELTPEVELVIYRVAQEALTNVVRHSGSDHAELRLDRQDGRLVLTVRDQGQGLPAGHVPGTGMRGMRERATLIGAKFEVTTSFYSGGCEVRLDVPLEAGR